MTRKRIFLIAQAALCALTAAFLAAAALRLYLSGAGGQAGGLFDPAYTREKAGAKLLPILPLFFTALGLTLAGLILGIKDEKAEKPVRDEILLKDLGSIQNKAVHQTATQGELYARVAIITLAVCMIIAGIINGGLEDVLAKGATICTECVGLG